MNIYFVTAGNKDEIKVIRELQPKNILISYFFFRKREKIEKLIEAIGYKPNILFDSGAYSSMTRGKDLSVTGFMKFLKENEDLLNEYIQLDYFGNEFITKSYYEIMKYEGFNPIPVFHYGFSEELLEYFVNQGERKIALGGTVPISNKRLVSEWIKFYTWTYPEIEFHLLGSSSLKILNHCDLSSIDSSTWIMQSANGKPNHIKSKHERMIYHMKSLMEYEEGSKRD